MKKPAPGKGQALSKAANDHLTPLPTIEPVARELLGDPNGALSKKTELRFGTHGSLAVNLDSDQWYDHEAEAGGGVLDLIAARAGIADRAGQLTWLEDHGFKERQEKPKPAKLEEVCKYRYNDARGKCRFLVARFEPKTFRQGHLDDRSRFVPGVKNIETRIPYRLDKITAQPEADVYLVEGEKDVHRLEELGLVATCNAGGAGKWTDEHSKHLASRRVVILPDNDEPGFDHARKARASLDAAGAQVRVLCLPDLPPKGDVSDWLDAGGTKERLLVLAEESGHDLPEVEFLQAEEDGQEDDEKKQSQSDLIVAFVRTWNDLFHDENDVAYARSRETGEVRPLGSRAFRNWLTAAFYDQTEKAIRDQALREAKMTLEGLAMQDHRPVHIRVAGKAGDYWLDLGLAGSSRAVRLRAGQWTIEDAELMFCRSDSAQPLPDPVPGGDIDLLWRIANVPEHARLLVVAWLVECLRLDTPFPVLELLGEHGSAKSTAQTAMRRLIDPNAADLRGVPKSAEDLFISGGVNHIISIENVSHLPSPLQDAMCVVATGGGFAKRKLYSDSEETVITLKRPIVLNGISAAVTQQDLVSRAVTVEMPVIESAQAKDSLEAEFEANRASILGGLLDIAAKALGYLPEMTLPAHERPRLVEFAYLGMAVAKAMGKRHEDFLTQFTSARQDGLERTLDSSPVATAIRDWAEIHPGETRTLPAGQWLAILEDYKPRGSDAWPKSGKGLGDAIRRSAPALRQLGIECKSIGKMSGGYVGWEVGKKVTEPKSPKSQVTESSDRDLGLGTSGTSHKEVSSNREVF
ncbi:MAG: hypothetical protein U9Q35_03095 [Pseudomonadota bacterium]|nr:hypothetical protein [Pseudomonadota bacterium]